MDVAVITGAGRGLGREIAKRLAGRGLAVCIADIDEAGAARTAAELGGDAFHAAVDVRDPASLRALAATASERGRIAVWVNNAGVARSAYSWNHPDDDVELIVRVNLLGVVNGSRVAVEWMRETGGGRILNMGSLSSIGPTPGLAVYGATKHGVLAFSLSLQGELDEAGIPVEVRAFCPGTTATPMIEEEGTSDEALVLFTAGQVLDPARVADRAVAVLHGRRLKAVFPHWRGVVLRSLLFLPRPSMRALPLMKRTAGRIGRRRFERHAG